MEYIFWLEHILWVEYILVGIYILGGIYCGWREGEKMLTLHSQPLQQALGCYLHFRTLAAPSGWNRPHRSTITLGLQRPAGTGGDVMQIMNGGKMLEQQ